MKLDQFKITERFFGRRKGRKLSKSDELAIVYGNKYILKESKISNYFRNHHKKIILEIGYGDGENLVNSAMKNPRFSFIGADPFINGTAKCLKKLLKYKIKNVTIWSDDVRKIIKLFPNESISEIKVLFPDPWPKEKHKNRRLIQNEFIESIHPIINKKGTITIATDHAVLKGWILETFQRNTKFRWIAQCARDWQSRPKDCFQTKYEIKSLKKNKKPSWFIFQKV